MTTPLVSPPKPDEEDSLHNHFPKFNFNPSDINVLEHFQTNVSSLYSSQPQFNYPVIRFKEIENDWKTLAKEVLTPFAPQYPIYDYQKFIPEKHKNRLGFQFITTMKTEHSDAPFFPEKSAMKANPFGITLHPSIKDNKKSQTAAPHKVSFKDLPLALKNTKSIERLSHQPYMNSQHFSIGSRAELLRADDDRSSPFIKDFLIRKQAFNNNGLVPTQQRRKSLEDTRPVRPQSSADVLRRRKDDQLLHFDEDALLGNSHQGSEESLLQDLKGLDFIRNRSPSKSEKHKTPNLLGTIKLLQNTLKAGTPKSRLITPRSSKLQIGMVTPRSRQGTPKSRDGPITFGERSYGRFSNLYEERSKEYSLINELKYSGILRKPTFEEEKTMHQVGKNHLKRHIRRKSDVSKYSGGECLKLTKNGDIVLTEDFAKKSAAFFGKNVLGLKRKNVSTIKTKDPSSHNSQHEDHHVFKGAESEVKSVIFDLPSSAQCSDSSSPQTKSSNQSPNRQPRLLRSDSLYRKVLQPKMRGSINPDLILAGKSPHSGSISRPKTRESLPRKSEAVVVIIKDLIEPMNKDLNQGLKAVLNLTSGAKKVLFTTDSERRSKTPSVNIRTHRVKDLVQNEAKRQAIKPLTTQEPVTLRDLSPYLGAQSFRGNDSRMTRIFSQDSGRITPNKRVIKKDENMKIKVLQKRHHSLPKVIGIETLLQK